MGMGGRARGQQNVPSCCWGFDWEGKEVSFILFPKAWGGSGGVPEGGEGAAGGQKAVSNNRSHRCFP